ncbi:MAG TPA: hypothetical protein VMR21_05105 [Vicinamibacteria bacterium]|nr:hypothetical protein [Vicinamibacteria bacterium]
MKALIATGLGVLGLGGVLVANSGRSASAQSSLAGPVSVNQAEASRTTLVNCGEGRQALVYTDPRTGQSQVQCVGGEAYLPGAVEPGFASALPVSQQFAPAIVSPVQPAVQERVVYREAPVYRSTPRSTSARRTASTSASAPVYSRGSETEPAREGRSWKKSAVIIGGSTAAGAGVGAVLDGKSGAKKGAVVGLLGGTIYDIATRNK